MTEDRELGALMRDAMTAEARQVSAGTALTERMIATATAGSDVPVRTGGGSRAWQAWVPPMAAAVLVALLVSSALIGGKLLHSSHGQPGNQVAPLPSATSPSSTASTGPAPSSTPSSSASQSVPVPGGPAGGAVPAGFRAVDLSWISTDDGWALGTAPCSNAPCTSIVRTADGGKHWVGIPAPKAGLTQYPDCPGTLACIGSLRFANARDGYAFGPSALFVTTDGGQNWRRGSGGAYGLEVSNGSVLRVLSNCLPGCPFTLQRSAVGTDSWSTVALPAGGQTYGAQLVRGGHTAALLTEGHVAGGAQGATSVLFTSTDDGASWTSRGEPCPQTAVEYDSIAATIAPDSAIVLTCNARMPVTGTSGQFTMTSTDGGNHFVRSSAGLGRADASVVGAASAGIQFLEADGLYRSVDGGAHWQPVTGTAPKRASFIGFENGQVGRIIDGTAATNAGQSDQAGTSATIWTTTDAGRSWTSYTFH